MVKESEKSQKAKGYLERARIYHERYLIRKDNADLQDAITNYIDAVKYEAKAYIEERKWGVKEASIDFRDIDPFNGVQADEVPITDEQPQPKKRGRKPKKVA
jgi:hypothetical protein